MTVEVDVKPSNPPANISNSQQRPRECGGLFVLSEAEGPLLSVTWLVSNGRFRCAADSSFVGRPLTGDIKRGEGKGL
jgi:hypothetical protein